MRGDQESGACARIDGRASLPGRAGPRKAALHALSVLFSFARLSVQRVDSLSADQATRARRYHVNPLREGCRVSIVDRPLDRRRDTPVADRKQNRVALLGLPSGHDADFRSSFAGKLISRGFK